MILLIFMALQGRDWKMDCFGCCCFTAFPSKTFPWYGPILLILDSIMNPAHNNN